MSQRALNRVMRRETHSPRTVAMIVAALVAIAVLVFVGIEIVLALLARPALVVAPADAAGLLGDVPFSSLAVGVGVGLALVGLVFVVLALTPGRHAKHRMDLDGRATVVDNGVIASALAQRVSDELGISREQITVGVAHRTVDVTVRPEAGLPLDKDLIRSVAVEEMASYRLTPPVKTVVKVVRPKEPELTA
jgi:hypothetical protein